MRISFLVFLLLGYNVIQAQNDSIQIKGWNITYSPSALINPMPGWQFGVERVFNENATLELEAAKIFDPVLDSDIEDTELTTGFRIKLGYKRFRRKRVMFLATFYLRRTNHDLDEWVSRFDNSFQQRIQFRKVKTLFGPTVGWGFVETIHGPLKFEAALNIGAGRYIVRTYDLPEDAEERTRLFDWYSNTGDYLYPIIGFSIKLKYMIF